MSDETINKMCEALADKGTVLPNGNIIIDPRIAKHYVLRIVAEAEEKVRDEVRRTTKSRMAAARRQLANEIVEQFRYLPRHRPTNTSLWDGVQMQKAIDVVEELVR